MKLLRLVSLVSSVVIGFSLSGCAGDTGTTPGTALNAYSHGQYWHAKANDSVAKNAYSFAGFDVNFKGTVAKLAMRQPFVLFKGLTFQKLCLPGAFRPGDHHNKMLRPGLCVVHASPQYL